MTAITDLHNLAGQSLLRFSEFTAELVLDPSVRLDDADLQALRDTRKVLVDLAFLGNNRQRATRGSAHTVAEVISSTQAFPGSGRSDAAALLTRLDHHLTLLQRMHGAQEAPAVTGG